MSKMRNVPDPYDPIFLRRSSKGGYAGIKAGAWTSMKRSLDKDTTLFEDFVFARREVMQFIDLLEAVGPKHFKFTRATWSVHPWLNPDEREEMLISLKDEVKDLPLMWRRFTNNSYRLPEPIRALYSKEQLTKTPDLTPEGVSAEHLPFLEKKDRLEYERLQYLREMKEKRGTPFPMMDDGDDEEIVLVDD